MIPKQLFFIWFGDNQPDYVDFTIKNFQEVNPDFKIDLIKYSKNDLENYTSLEDKSLKNSCEIALKLIKEGKNPESYFTIVSDYYRLYLIHHYGGIYLDCDTFPVKPFDDKLLNNEQFFVTRGYYDANIKKEHFFMGSVKKPDKQKYQLLYPINSYSYDKDYVELKNKFLSCEFKYGEHYEKINKRYKYIEHFSTVTWKKTNVNNIKYLSKYDT